jgi:hypothetical protein
MCENPSGLQPIAADELTELQIAATLSSVIGWRVGLAELAIRVGEVPASGQVAMYKFLNGQGDDGDFPALRKIYPDLRTFDNWLREPGWENA